MGKTKRPAVRMRILLLVSCCLLGVASVHAEKADRNKPVYIESDTATTNEAQHVTTFTGHVVLTQGTLVIKANKLVVHQDADGFKDGVAYGDPAHFRQKRDGVNEYVNGYGQRIQYDQRQDTLQLFTHARMIRGQDDVRGDYISYDGKTEFFQVLGGGQTTSGQGRVHAVIMPKKKTGGGQAVTPGGAVNPTPSTP